MCDNISQDDLRDAVREHYAKIATEVTPATNGKSNGKCCGGGGGSNTNSCFGYSTDADYAAAMGYTSEDLNSVPEGANIGQSCGNPMIFANLKEGETILDLGSGAGFNCFMASKRVGPNGLVIGVDMTPEMIKRSRDLCKKRDYKNVEFRLGEIEHLPVADSSVDIIISNCVINLIPDKIQAFKEMARVLKKGGRLCISDVVMKYELPAQFKNDIKMYAGCISGAMLISNIESWLTSTGFVDVKVTPEDESKEFIKDWVPGSKVEDFIVSALIEGVKA